MKRLAEEIKIHQNPKRLNLSNCLQITSTTLDHFLEVAPQALEELYLVGCRNVTVTAEMRKLVQTKLKLKVFKEP
jgi:hypothetical protein